MTRSLRTLSLAALALAASAAFAEKEVVVLANNGTTGDSVASTGTDTFVPLTKNPSLFGYNNIRAGSAGIDDTYARSGLSSFHISNTNGKADLEFYNGGFALSSLGRLADLSTFGYDYYRSSASTAQNTLAPVLRLLVDADGDFTTANDRGTVVYEPIYSRQTNGMSTVIPTNVWNTVSATPTDGQFFIRFGNQNQYQGENGPIQNGVTLSYLTNPNTTGELAPLNNGKAAVYGFSVGYGTGMGGTFDGAADNVRLGFGTNEVTRYNFERAAAPVPEPATMAALGFGALGLLKRRRKAAK